MLTQEDREQRWTRFDVIPAVDLLGDAAVRLERGDFRRVIAREADRARSGRIRPDVVRRLAQAAAPALIQASGGIRSLSDAASLLEAGAARVVVGTAAFSGQRALELYRESLGERLVVAIDVREGRVVASGWTEATDLSAVEAAERCAAAGVSRLLCTAVDRDGTLDGPDLDLIDVVRAHSGLPVIAAGGIGSLADLAAIARLGCEGAIVGRALLDGRLPLSILQRP